MNYKQHLKKKTSFLNKQGEYDRFLFKNRSTDETVKSQAERVLQLPPQLGQYQYDVQQGLQIQTSRGRSRTRIIILATCCALSLMWWLSTSSRASYEDLPNILLSTNSTPSDMLRALGLTDESNFDAFPTSDNFVQLLEDPRQRFSDLDPDMDVETETALLDPINGVLLESENTEEFSPWLDVSVSNGDTLSTIFERFDLNKAQLYQLLTSSEYSKRLERLRPDQTLRIKRDESGNLEDLVLVLDFEQELHISRKNDQFVQEIRKREIDNRLVYVHGCVENSLYIDGQNAGLMGHQVLELKNIFRNNFSLRNLQKGDHFTVVFQQYIFEGEKETGDILAAEFVHEGKAYHAVRLTDNNGQRAEYYKPTKQGQEAFAKLTGQLNDACQVRQSALANEAAPVTLGKTKLAWQADTDNPQSVFINDDDESNLLSWIQPDIDKPKHPKPEPVIIVAEKPKATKKPTNTRASTNTNSNKPTETRASTNTNNNKPTEKPRTANRATESNPTNPNRGNRQTQPKLTARPSRQWSPISPLSNDRANIVLASAHSLLGTPYKYGGTTPTGFDCSGFVLYNMRQAGIQMPRTAREQFARTSPVSRSNLKVGDLVFFRVRHRYVDHVGIYVGNDEFIHAESSRKPVNITSLNHPFYSKYFVGGGRHGN